MPARPVRAPKLTLKLGERLALRRAHLATIDLVRLTPEELSRACQGTFTSARARQLCALARLQQLPSVGPSIAADLLRLGLHSTRDAARADPQRMLDRLERMEGRQDPCVGDVLRCAVWHAQHPSAAERPWWEWSRARLAGGVSRGGVRRRRAGQAARKDRKSR